MSSEEMVTRIVAVLKQARLDQDLSQRKLGKRAGVSYGGIQHMENGEVTPTLLFLTKVARALGMKIGPVVTGAEEGECLEDLMKLVTAMQSEPNKKKGD